MMGEFDLRLNSPVISERVSGELLYRQIRQKPLTYCPVPDDAFSEENTDLNLVQAWTAPLTLREASAVAGYVSREARWLDVMHTSPARAVSEMGESQYRRLAGLEDALLSAAGKSLTHSLLLRHYVRGIPSPPPGEPPLKGRVYVLKSYTSCSLVHRDYPGYGMSEIRIAVPSGAGRGLFVSPPGASLAEAEFLLPPGSTIRIAGGGGRCLLTELVRPLSLSWSSDGATEHHGLVRDVPDFDKLNTSLINAYQSIRPPGIFPEVPPAPTVCWI